MKMSVLNENLLDMNKGEEYWFGDPCYVFDAYGDKQPVWDSFVSLIDGRDVGIAVLNGHKVLFMNIDFAGRRRLFRGRRQHCQARQGTADQEGRC